MGYYDEEGDESPANPSGRRWRLMHFTLVMLTLLFISKVAEVATGAQQLLSIREAQASTENAKDESPNPAAEVKVNDPAEEKAAKADAEAEHKEAAKEDSGHGGTGGHGGEAPPKEEVTRGAGKLTVKEVEALKAGATNTQYTKTELDLLQNLTRRRTELDEREKELELKAKVLEATEKRLNDKVVEMKALEGELSKVVAQYNTQQDSEIKSLVKIYESMKPADAAKIFNEMDMPILLAVIDKMSERKVAPVLAGMDPRKARDVTQELAEMRRGRSGLKAAANAAAGTARN